MRGALLSEADELEDIVSAPVLSRILQEVPFGLDITAVDGRLIFSNAFAETHGGQALKHHVFPAHVRDGEYSVQLWLDESADEEHRRDLFQKAYFDALTGLPNRAVLEQSVAALIKDDGARFALAFIDLDRFRHINEYFGTAVGDALLVKVAERMSFDLGPSDLLTRVAGNSFVLLLGLDDHSPDAMPRIESMGQRLREPFYVDRQEIFTSASIGVTVFPDDGHVFGTLHWNAERAMRGARLSCAGSIRAYDRSIERAVATRNRAEQRLRLAIRDRRVTCAFQPKVDLRSGLVSGVEALMRWRDEDGVIQPPGSMLGIASELGLIDDVAQMVLDHALTSVDCVRAAFGDDCTISINVASGQAGNERFMRDFVGQLEATGFASRFIIEVTEDAFLAKDNFQRRILPLIRDVGARVSIDDFGTGYSSLSALADITADELKIDRAFVTDVHRRPRSQNVLKAIEALGHSLGMTIVVEGVETAEELAYLRANTCIQLGQGYYFARPALLDEIAPASRFEGARIFTQSRPSISNRR